MKGHGQFCPVAVASDVFAHRWTPLVLRELCSGSTRFNEILRGLPLISKTTLIERLRALENAGVVECVETGTSQEYRLTDAGAEFHSVIEALGTWGQRWATRFDPHNLDADLLMWNVSRRLFTELLPETRTMVRFEFTGFPAGYRRGRVFWLLIEDREPGLCLRDPGIEADLRVDADMKSFAQMWLGDIALNAARRDGSIRITGRRELVKAFPDWLRRSKFADVPRPPPDTRLA